MRRDSELSPLARDWNHGITSESHTYGTGQRIKTKPCLMVRTLRAKNYPEANLTCLRSQTAQMVYYFLGLASVEQSAISNHSKGVEIWPSYIG
jgi:hypothetical protein